MCLNGGWGSICRDFWNNADASVVCRQLGYSPYGTYKLLIGCKLQFTFSLQEQLVLLLHTTLPIQYLIK